MRNLEIAINKNLHGKEMDALCIGLYEFDDVFRGYNLHITHARIKSNAGNAIYYNLNGGNDLSKRLSSNVNGMTKLYVVDKMLISHLGRGDITILPSVIDSRDIKDFGIISFYSIDKDTRLKFLAREVSRIEFVARSGRIGADNTDFDSNCGDKNCLLYFPDSLGEFGADEIRKGSFKIKEYFENYNAILRKSEGLCPQHKMGLFEIINLDRLARGSSKVN